MTDQPERRAGMQELHDDIRGIIKKVDENLNKTTRIETALWPSPGQPSKLEQLEGRVSSLETARAWAVGAFAAISSLFGYHVSRH
jgi:hypothetical protein